MKPFLNGQATSTRLLTIKGLLSWDCLIDSLARGRIPEYFYPRYLLADINEDLINLYLYLQQEGRAFISYCREFFGSENNRIL